MDYSYIDRILNKLERSTPCTAENEDGDCLVISSVKSDDGTRGYMIECVQPNGYIRTNIYYEDGSSEEYYDI